MKKDEISMNDESMSPRQFLVATVLFLAVAALIPFLGWKMQTWLNWNSSYKDRASNLIQALVKEECLK